MRKMSNDREWSRRKQEAKVRGLWSSDSIEEEEIQKQLTRPALVEGADPHNKNITVDKLLEGSFYRRG
jgi:hypothetical protein